MKLIASLTSPYARKVRVALLEKGLAFDFVNEAPWEPGSRIADYNPLGKVPALETDSGEIFFDSPIIIDYLETLPCPVRLVQASGLEAVRLRQLEALADGITDAGVAWLLETRRSADKQDATLITRQRSKLDRGLDALEQKLHDQEWLSGDALTIADIATGCCVLWLDFRLPSYNWRDGRPRLAAYADKLAARESFQQSIPVA